MPCSKGHLKLVSVVLDHVNVLLLMMYGLKKQNNRTSSSFGKKLSAWDLKLSQKLKNNSYFFNKPLLKLKQAISYRPKMFNKFWDQPKISKIFGRILPSDYKKKFQKMPCLPKFSNKVHTLKTFSKYFPTPPKSKK